MRAGRWGLSGCARGPFPHRPDRHSSGRRVAEEGKKVPRGPAEALPRERGSSEDSAYPGRQGDSRNGGRKWAVREASQLEVWRMETGTGRETVLQDMETGRCGRTDQRAGSRVLTGKTRDRIRV